MQATKITPTSEVVDSWFDKKYQQLNTTQKYGMINRFSQEKRELKEHNTRMLWAGILIMGFALTGLL